MQSFENKATYLNIRNVLLFLMNTCLPSWNELVVYEYIIKKQSGTCSMEFKKGKGKFGQFWASLDNFGQVRTRQQIIKMGGKGRKNKKREQKFEW